MLLVPGGYGPRREVFNAELISWIAEVSKKAKWVTSVCTGALLLHEAGIARGRRVATHHEDIRAQPCPVRQQIYPI